MLITAGGLTAKAIYYHVSHTCQWLPTSSQEYAFRQPLEAGLLVPQEGQCIFQTYPPTVKIRHIYIIYQSMPTPSGSFADIKYGSPIGVHNSFGYTHEYTYIEPSRS